MNLKKILDSRPPVINNNLNLFLLRHIKDDFEVVPSGDGNYNVVRNNKPVYSIEKKDINYHCSCRGFQFRGKCKHIDELNKQLKGDAPVKPGRHPRADFEKFFPELEQICAPFDKWEAVGSWRRKKSTFGDIDIIAIGDAAWKKVHQNLVDSGDWEETIYGDTLMRGTYHGYDLDFNLCPSEELWVWWLLYRTGSASLNKAMRYRAVQMGYALSEKPLSDRFTWEPVHGLETEEDIFNFLGFEYLEPTQRENPNNLRDLPGFDIEANKSPGLLEVEQGNIVWDLYLKETIEKLKHNETYAKQAKYKTRFAIVVARELARRTRTPVETILSSVTPEEIQPEGIKPGQQTWTASGEVLTKRELDKRNNLERDLFNQ